MIARAAALALLLVLPLAATAQETPSAAGDGGADRERQQLVQRLERLRESASAAEARATELSDELVDLAGDEAKLRERTEETAAKVAGLEQQISAEEDKLERLILALAKANRDLLHEEPHLFAALSQAVAKRHAISRRNRTRVRALFERVIDDGIATGAFEPRDRDRAIAFVIDATHRFIHPASLELEADVPQASVDARLATLIRVALRTLATGVI